eukprot:3548520-Rhodomonas_salina.1
MVDPRAEGCSLGLVPPDQHDFLHPVRSGLRVAAHFIPALEGREQPQVQPAVEDDRAGLLHALTGEARVSPARKGARGQAVLPAARHVFGDGAPGPRVNRVEVQELHDAEREEPRGELIEALRRVLHTVSEPSPRTL